MTEAEAGRQPGVGPGHSSDAGSDAGAEARAEIRAAMTRKGHTVEIAATVRDLLGRALESGSLSRTPALDAMLTDLSAVLDHADDERLGGKSGDAARLILRAIDRALDAA